MSDESSYQGDNVEGDKVQGDKVQGGDIEGDVERLTHLDNPLPHPRQDDENDIADGTDDEGAEE